MESEPPDKVAIAKCPTARKAHEYGLVVLSGKAPYWVESFGDHYLLLVHESSADHFSEQIRRYESESKNWPPRANPFPEAKANIYPALVWVLILVFCYIAQTQWPEFKDSALADSEKIMNGEWWRVGSALLLHADLAHLAGNALFGALFLWFAGQITGAWKALLLTFICGGLGNALNAWVYYPELHLSLGASTAVFATVGLLSSFPLGYGFREFMRLRFKLWAAPLISGLVILAWFGTGDVQTDVGAHLFGFLVALPFGALLGFLEHQKFRNTSEQILRGGS